MLKARDLRPQPDFQKAQEGRNGLSVCHREPLSKVARGGTRSLPRDTFQVPGVPRTRRRD